MRVCHNFSNSINSETFIRVSLLPPGYGSLPHILAFASCVSTLGRIWRLGSCGCYCFFQKGREKGSDLPSGSQACRAAPEKQALAQRGLTA